MPESDDPEKVSNNDLRNSQFAGGFINADTVNAKRIGGDIIYYSCTFGQQQAPTGNPAENSQQMQIIPNLDEMRPSLDCWQGRAEEIEQIYQWIADDSIRLIGITGLGGSGKSTLASKIYEDESIKFDKKFWADVSLRVTFTELARRVLLRLGLSKESVEAIPELLLVNVLVNHLREGRYLLVIDNLESLLQKDGQSLDIFYEQFFQGWLGCGGKSKILLTSRERPNLPDLKSQWLPLSGLKPKEGATLLRVLGILGTDAELQDFVERAQGHPLLLMLVAGFLKKEEELDPQISHLQRYGLADVPQMLVDDRLEGLHRHKVDIWMRLVLDASFNRLSPKLQALLLNLSVFRRSFNLAVVTAMVPGVKVLQQDLKQIAKASLLQWEKDTNGELWFQFHPLILAYIKQKAGDLTEAHERAINYYRSIAKEQPWQTLEDLIAYVEIFYHYYELKQYALAFNTVSICDNFLSLQDYQSTRIELYNQLIEEWHPNDTHERGLFSNTLNFLGSAYTFLGQHKKAIDYFQQSLIIAREINYHCGEGTALCNLAMAYKTVESYQIAIDYYQQSLKILQAICHCGQKAHSLRGLGSAYRSLGQYQQAINYHQQSLAIYKEIGSRYGQASSLNNLGNVYNGLIKYQQAIDYFQQSLTIKQEIGDRYGQANSLNNLGNAYNFLGQYQIAIDYHQQSLSIRREIKSHAGEAGSLLSLGIVYNSLERYQEAIDYYQKALTIYREIGGRHSEANSLNHLGNAYNSLGQHQTAIDYHQQSLPIYREIGDSSGEGGSLCNLGNAYSSLGEYQKAINYYQEALTILQPIGHHPFEANSYFGLGNAYKSLKQYQQAISYYQQCLKIRQEICDRSGEAVVLSNLGNTYYFLEQYQEAVDYYQHLLEIQREIGDRLAEANSLNSLGSSYYSLREYERAIEYHQQSLAIRRENSDRLAEAESLNSLGSSYFFLRQYERAIEYHQQSLAIRRDIGDRRAEASSLQALALLYHQTGKVTEGFAASSQAHQILIELEVPLDDWMMLPQWMKLSVKFSQRSQWHLALCLFLGLVAFPLAVIWFVALISWRVVSARFRRQH